MRFFTLSLAIIVITLSIFPALEPSDQGHGLLIPFASSESNQETNSTVVYPFDEYFLDYMGYDNYTEILFQLQARHSDIMRVYDLTALTENGATWYDRVVWGVKISDGVSSEPEWYDDPDEEDVVIVGLHHAREWMSIMVPLYFIYYLVEFYGESEIDNDMDGRVDEDPMDGIDNDGDGEDNDGDPGTIARMDGHDNDGDGLIDEGIDEDCIEGLATFLVNHREIWVVPLLNPDGYEYDRTISQPGQGGGWRKNCRDQSQNGGKRSDGNGHFDEDNDGVDLNRNYPYEWNRNEKGYVVDTNGITVTSDSRQESDAQYRGPDDDIDDDDDGYLGIDPVSGNRIYDPDRVDEDYWNFRDDDGDGLVDEDKDGGFTEPETQAMDELMKRLDIYDEDDTSGYPEGYRPENYDRQSNVITGISYHSYSALVIWPWGYTYEDPPHEPLLRHIGETMMEITDYGSWKDQGGYKVSGEWGDWMYGSHGVLAYTIELNTGSQGGFHPMQEMIIPTVRMNLGCNIYITEIAGKAKVARDHDGTNLNFNFPEFVYNQKEDEIKEGEEFKVTVNVMNQSNLEQDSVCVWYRVDEGDWRQETLIDKGGGVFKGSLPDQDSGSTVYFYFEGKDVRGTYVYSGFGEGTPYSFKVKDEGFLRIGWIDGLLALLAIALLLQMRNSRGTKRME